MLKKENNLHVISWVKFQQYVTAACKVELQHHDRPVTLFNSMPQPNTLRFYNACEMWYNSPAKLFFFFSFLNLQKNKREATTFFEYALQNTMRLTWICTFLYYSHIYCVFWLIRYFTAFPYFGLIRYFTAFPLILREME